MFKFPKYMLCISCGLGLTCSVCPSGQLSHTGIVSKKLYV